MTISTTAGAFGEGKRVMFCISFLSELQGKAVPSTYCYCHFGDTDSFGNGTLLSKLLPQWLGSSFLSSRLQAHSPCQESLIWQTGQQAAFNRHPYGIAGSGLHCIVTSPCLLLAVHRPLVPCR